MTDHHRHRRRHRRRGPRALALLACAALLVACAPADDAARSDGRDDGDVGSIRVGPLSTQNTLTLALHDGVLAAAVADAGGEVAVTSPFPAFAPAAEAVLAGRVDMTTGSSTALVPALHGGADVVVFAVEHDDGDTQGIVAAPGTGIRTVRDLAGRSVAVNVGGTGDYLLRTALAREGMTIDDVDPVPLGPADAATAFTTGQVDAWATWDQYLALATRTDGSTVLAVAADIGATNRTVHVVSRDVLTDHPGLVRAAFEALREQAAAVAASPDLLRDAYLADGATDAVAEHVAAWTPPTIVPADDAFRAELQGVADVYAQWGLTASVVDVTDAVVDVRTLP